MEIVKAEGLSFDLKQLWKIATWHQCDVRAAICTLQMIAKEDKMQALWPKIYISTTSRY